MNFSLDVEVCDSVPKIRLLGYPVSLSFIVDTTKVNPADLCFDGLGMFVYSFNKC